MSNKELEELIYEYGHVLYQIGRAETDDKAETKQYNRLISQKEKIVEKFDAHFKSSIKVSKSLNLT